MKHSHTYITYHGVALYVEYDYSDYVPEVRWLMNGDPGYPAEGGDFDITSVMIKDVQIFEMLTEDQLKEIEDIITNPE